MNPNFIIAGGVAAGTSFLSATLTHHPDIYLPRIQRPEPNFFHYSWKYDQGLDWYRKTWFHEVGTQRAIGERSSLLMTSDVAAKRIKDAFPDIKLIFCLRNPIERAWGNYRFSVLEGLEPLSFDEALDSEADRMQTAEGKWAEVQPHAYQTRSRYSAHLQTYIDLFGKEQILMLKSEDLGANPKENIIKVCDFLGVDNTVTLNFPPNYSSPTVHNPAIQAEMRMYFGDRYAEIIEGIRKVDDMSAFIRTQDDKEMVERLKANLGAGKDPLPEVLRKKLQILLADEIQTMRNLVEFSIDDWQ